MIVEPIQLGGCGVEAEKVVREPFELRRAQVFDRAMNIGFRKGIRRPGIPSETILGAIWFLRFDVENDPIKRRALHLHNMLAHKRGAGLVPPELDQLLLFCRGLGTDWRERENTEKDNEYPIHGWT